MTITPKEMREKRLNAGLSLNAAALEWGVPKRLIIAVEAGSNVRPHPGNAKKLADFYGCLVTDLWPVEDEDAGAVAS